jgi:hypothetical protein
MNQPSNLDLGVWLEQEALPLLKAPAEELDIGALSARSRTILLAWTLLGEVGNGGTDQYFFNVGHWAYATVECLKCIGAEMTAARLADLAAHYPNGIPSRDLEAARAEYELLPPAFFDACTEFDQFLMGDDSTGYKLEEDLHPLVYRYTSANP